VAVSNTIKLVTRHILQNISVLTTAYVAMMDVGCK